MFRVAPAIKSSLVIVDRGEQSRNETASAARPAEFVGLRACTIRARHDHRVAYGLNARRDLHMVHALNVSHSVLQRAKKAEHSPSTPGEAAVTTQAWFLGFTTI